MNYWSISFVFVIWCAPSFAQHAHVDDTGVTRPKVTTIHESQIPHTGDGNFKYNVQFSDGLQAEQIGYRKVGGSKYFPRASAVQEGSYTTFDEGGQVVGVNYVADKHGFRVSEDSLPQGPVENLVARNDILQQQAQIRDEHARLHAAAHERHAAASESILQKQDAIRAQHLTLKKNVLEKKYEEQRRSLGDAHEDTLNARHELEVLLTQFH